MGFRYLLRLSYNRQGLNVFVPGLAKFEIHRQAHEAGPRVGAIIAGRHEIKCRRPYKRVEFLFLIAKPVPVFPNEDGQLFNIADIEPREVVHQQHFVPVI